jgi:hypothetical protein
MIYLYDEKGVITAEYEDWKLRDVELDIHNGSLSGAVLRADDIRHFKFADGRYAEKTVDEKYAEKLITKQERDDLIARDKAVEREQIIRAEMRAMAEERAKLLGKII